MQEEGGDPKTDQHVPSGGEVKTGLHVPSGGEVKTDHFDFSLRSAGVLSVNADSPHPGGLATQTAYSSTVSPVLDPVLRLSHGSEVRDAFPSWQEKTVQFDDLTGDPVRFDEFPSTAESRDGLPSSADSMDHTNLDSTPFGKSTGFTHIFRISENSERLRESDPGVQIVPASRSPSELSAHQMGLSMAGASRLNEESIHSIPGTSALAIGGQEQLSISDRALLRKYGPSGQRQETLGNQTLTMGLFQLFRGLMGTLHKGI